MYNPDRSQTGFSILKPKSGIAIFIVVIFCILIFISIAFLHEHSMKFRGTSVSLVEETICFEAALAATQIYWEYLGEVFRERKGCRKLYPDNPDGSMFISKSPEAALDGLSIKPADLDSKSYIESALQELITQTPPLKSLSTEAIFRVADDHSKGSRLWEKILTGRIEMKIKIETLKKTTYEFVFPRFFKLINYLPIPTSKFTAFIRTCQDQQQYNIIDKTFNQDSSTIKPFIIYNSSFPFSSIDRNSWLHSGWIFHGGQNIFINIDGTHFSRNESEHFLFWPTHCGKPTGTGYPFYISPHLGTTKLRVKTTPIGCFSEWATTPALSRVLNPDSGSKITFSSALRLFGDSGRMTPTLIFGEVYAQYILYSTLIYDANNDSVADTIKMGNQDESAIFPLPRILSNEEYHPPAAPQIVNANGSDLFLNADGLQDSPSSLEDIMPAYAAGAKDDYINHMTKCSCDFPLKSGVAAYNSLYDKMFERQEGDSSDQFPPRHLFSSGGGSNANNQEENYPNSGKNFDLPIRMPNVDSLFQGDLNILDPSDFYKSNKSYFSHRFNSGEQFVQDGVFEKIGRDIVISKPFSAIIAGDLNLSTHFSNILVAAPAVIVVSGNIKIGNVGAYPAREARSSIANDSFHSGKLILISLNGDIEATGDTMEANLLAPNGTLKMKNPVNIRGNLCVNRLDPVNTSVTGGSVRYDEENDPTDPQVFIRGFCFILGPNVPMLKKK